jgi:hypothetical protein
MVLTLTTTFEETVWNEWSKRLPTFNTYFVRRAFYPNRMTELDNLVRQFVETQRKSTQLLINNRGRLPKYWDDLTEDQKEKWQNTKTLIKNLDKTLQKCVIDNNVGMFMESLETLESQRIADLINHPEEDSYEATIREAAEALIEFSNKAHEECKRKFLKQKIVEVGPVRRSSRLVQKSTK